jgi:hypothetical protein
MRSRYAFFPRTKNQRLTPFQKARRLCIFQQDDVSDRRTQSTSQEHRSRPPLPMRGETCGERIGNFSICLPPRQRCEIVERWRHAFLSLS